jgi:hypothetical protein
MKDPDKVQPPVGECFLFALCVDDPKDLAPFLLLVSLLGDLPLDLCHGATIEGVVSGVLFRTDHRQFNSRRQLDNCIERGAAKFIQAPPVQSPVEDGADLSAG